jgi:hypothetical protein
VRFAGHAIAEPDLPLASRTEATERRAAGRKKTSVILRTLLATFELSGAKD